MTELQSWQETFEACKAGGLKLPDEYTLDFRLFMRTADAYIPDIAALALCRMVTIEWLRWPIIHAPSRLEKQWYVAAGTHECEADTLDAALQAACKAKAATHKPQVDDDPNDCADDFTKGNY